MKILRATLYPPPGQGEPMTVVMRDRDLRDDLTIEEAARSLETASPGVLSTCEIFEAPDDLDITAATLEAKRRLDAAAERENNLAILYYWNAMTLTSGLGKTVVNERPAPLTADEMEPVLRQLSAHPAMSGRSLISWSKDHVVFTVNERGVKREQGWRRDGNSARSADGS